MNALRIRATLAAIDTGPHTPALVADMLEELGFAVRRAPAHGRYQADDGAWRALPDPLGQVNDALHLFSVRAPAAQLEINLARSSCFVQARDGVHEASAYRSDTNLAATLSMALLRLWRDVHYGDPASHAGRPVAHAAAAE